MLCSHAFKWETPMRTCLSLCAILSLFITLPAIGNEYSNRQKIDRNIHQHHFHDRLQSEFLVEGEVSTERIQTLMDHLEQKYESTKESFFMAEKMHFIERHNYSEKKAEKKARKRTGKDARVNFPYIYLNEKLNALKNNFNSMTQEQLKEELVTIGLVLETIDYEYQDHLYRGMIRGVKNVIKPFYRIPYNEVDKAQASNLTKNGKILDPSEVKELFNKGADLSLLNPPNNAFWTNNKVEEFSANSEVHRNEKFFPAEGTHFVYDRFGRGNVKVKADYYEGEVENICDTEKESHGVTFRVATETNNHLISTNLARAIGYPIIPHAKRKEVIMHLCKTSFEEFLAQWEVRNDFRFGTFNTHGEYLPELHAVKFRDVALESYPGKNDGRYKKVGQFRSQSMDLTNRREIRGQLILHALIALVDTKEGNQRIDFHRDENGNWNPLIYPNDLGRSLGFQFIRTHGTINDYFNSFVTEGDDHLYIWWDHTGLDPKLYESVTISDVKWVTRRLARLSDKQIDEIVNQSHHVAPVKALYANKIKSRISNLAHALKISEVIKFNIKTDLELHQAFPQYINESGRVTYEAEKIGDTSSMPIGTNTSFFELIELTLFNQVFAAISGKIEDSIQQEKKLINGISALGGTYDLGLGITLNAGRELNMNDDKREYENRIKIVDTLTINLPIGLLDRDITGGIFGATLPIGMQYSFQYKFFHSAYSIDAAAKKRFFNDIIPWIGSEVLEELNAGEGLYLQEAFLTSLGELSFELSDYVTGTIAPLSYKTTSIGQTYLYRTNEKLLEAAVSKTKRNRLASELNATAGVSFGYQWSRLKQKTDYTFYRYHLSDEENGVNESSVAKLAQGIIDGKDPEIGKAYVIRPELRATNLSGCFFIFCGLRGNSFSEIDIWEYDNLWNQDQKDFDQNPDQDFHTENQKTKVDKNNKIFIDTYQYATHRDFTRIWNDDVSLGSFEFAPNLFLDFAKEGKSRRIRVEGRLNAKKTKIKDLDIRIQIYHHDNYMSRDEFNDLKEQYTSLAYCGQEKDDFITYQMPEGIKFYSPMSSSMELQIQKDGIKDLLENLDNFKYCDDYCKNKVRGLQRFKVTDDASARRYLTKMKLLIKRVLGINFSKIGCFRKLMKKKNYWLVTKINNILDYDTPVAQGRVQLFGKEIGKYQGPSYSTEFQFEHYYRPINFRQDFAPKF